MIWMAGSIGIDVKTLKDLKRPPYEPQGQRSNYQQKWGYIQDSNVVKMGVKKNI